MATIENIKTNANLVKNASLVGENTAARVGGVLSDMADFLGNDLNEYIYENFNDQLEKVNQLVTEVEKSVEDSKETITELVNSLGVTQETGDSETKVMSQKAVSNELYKKMLFATHENDWLSGSMKKISVGVTVDGGLSVSSTRTNWHNCKLKVAEGEIYYISYLTACFYGDEQYTILDADAKVLASANSSGTTAAKSNFTLTMPEGATTLVLCTQFKTNDDGSIVYPEIYKSVKATEENEEYIEGEKLEMTCYKNSTTDALPSIGTKITNPSSYTGSKTDWGMLNYVGQVNSGDTLRIICNSGSYRQVFAILDSRNVVIDLYEVTHNVYFHNIVYTVPEGGCTLWMRCTKGSDNRVYRLNFDATKILQDAKAKETMLCAMSERVVNTSTTSNAKRLALAWASDTHGDVDQYRRFIAYVNAHRGELDAVLHTGDMNVSCDVDDGFVNTVLKYKPCIPLLPMLGNHDAFATFAQGTALTSGTQAWNGDKYIKPFADDDVTLGEDYCYYYRDFKEQKIRVIVINDYDRPRYVSTSNWQTTTDTTDISNAKEWDADTKYAVDDVVHYKGSYLKCLVSGVLANSNSLSIWSVGASTPLNKYSENCRHLSQEQVDFIISAMKVESGWNIIFASHEVLEPLTSNHTIACETFHARNCLTTNVISLYFGQDGNILADLIKSYLDKATLEKTYHAITPNANYAAGKLVNDTDILPDVIAKADFTNAKGDIVCWLNGHSHSDACYYSNLMGDKKLPIIVMNTSCFMAAGMDAKWFDGDLIKGEGCKDCFNIISFDTDEKNIRLLRIGADVNDELRKRDYAIINWEH